MLACTSRNDNLATGFVFGGGVDANRANAIKQGEDEAKDRANQAGEDAAARYRCTPPCQKVIHVAVDLWKPLVTDLYAGTGAPAPMFSSIQIATWRLSIMCVVVPPKAKGDKKAEDKAPGKGKAGKKPGKGGRRRK